jgi:hypothetical protein
VGPKPVDAFVRPSDGGGGRRRRVEYLHHEAVENHSDHDVLYCTVSVDGLELELASWNFGPGTEADLHRILTVLGPRGICGLQEASDRGAIVARVAEAHGYRVIDGTGERGQSATPLLVGPEVEILFPWWRLLLGRTHVGPGAGPDWSKAKWLGGAKMRLDGVKFGVQVFHELASLRNEGRFRAGVVIARGVASVLRVRRVPWFVLCDLNGTADSPIMRLLLRLGVTSNHVVLGSVGTHGRRGIDCCLVAARWLRKKRRGKA